VVVVVEEEVGIGTTTIVVAEEVAETVMTVGVVAVVAIEGVEGVRKVGCSMNCGSP